MRPMSPREVVKLTPSQIAAALALDLEYTVRARPLTDEQIASGAVLLDPPPRPDLSQPPGQQTLKRLIL